MVRNIADRFILFFYFEVASMLNGKLKKELTKKVKYCFKKKKRLRRVTYD